MLRVAFAELQIQSKIQNSTTITPANNGTVIDYKCDSANVMNYTGILVHYLVLQIIAIRAIVRYHLVLYKIFYNDHQSSLQIWDYQYIQLLDTHGKKVC